MGTWWELGPLLGTEEAGMVSAVAELTACKCKEDFPLYQVARLFPFISSLDLREGQVTPLRGVTNFELIQSGREASSHLCLPAHGLDPSPVSLLPTPVCVHVR